MSAAEKKPRRPIGLAVLGGFVLGAATVLLIVWLYGVPSGSPVKIPVPAANQVPALPAPAEEAPASPPIPPATESPGTGRPWSAPDTAADLDGRRLLLPVQGIRSEQLENTFDDARSEGRVHEAIDILAPRDTPIVAVEEGKIAKLFTSAKGGLTIYQFDPSESYCYYYAHLERYADGLREGDFVHRGQVLGYVGTSGNAPPDTPHLHFAIFRLGPEKKWWEGTAINPYRLLGGR